MHDERLSNERTMLNRRRHGRPARAALLVAVILTACSSATQRSSEGAAGEKCDDFEVDVERFWSRESRAAVRAGVLKANATLGRQVVERVETKMDALTRDWVMMQEGICKDTHVRAILPREVYVKVSLCLRSNLQRQRTLAITLQSATLEHIEHVDGALDEIGDEARECQEKAIYDYYDENPDDPNTAKARDDLAAASTYRALGDDRAKDAAIRAQRAAQRAGSSALLVNSMVEQGYFDIAANDSASAHRAAAAALKVANRVGYELGQAEAWELYGDIAHQVDSEYTLALMYHQRALDIRRQVLGESLDTAGSYNDLGLAQMALGTYKAALDSFMASLSLMERLAGKQHPQTASTYMNAGIAYSKLGDYDLGLAYGKKALVILENTLGSSHPSLSAAYGAMSEISRKVGQYANALEFSRKELAIDESLFGKDSLRTTSALVGIGQAHFGGGQYDLALASLEQAHVIREHAYGNDDPRLAITYNDLGLIHRKTGKYDVALQYYERALVLQERSLSANHPYLAVTHSNIGLAYFEQKQFDQALLQLRMALDIDEKGLGSDHPTTANVYFQLGRLYARLKRDTLATEWLVKALTVWRKSLGEDNKRVSMALLEIRDLCKKRKHKPACASLK